MAGSTEIIKIFTSNKNIEYLRDYFTKNISNNEVKEQILDTLLEDVVQFNDYNQLENNIYCPRRSIDVWNEVRKLNKNFIENRMDLVRDYDLIGKESYHMQMFIDDSLEPKGYKHLNSPYQPDLNKRIFRYEDPNDSNRSSIPIQQILSKGHMDRNIDELYDSFTNIYGSDYE